MLLLWKTMSHQEEMLSLSGKSKSVAETRKVLVEWLSKSSLDQEIRFRTYKSETNSTTYPQKSEV